MSERYLTLGGIIIDDLVYEDGTTSMGVLGGGGLYAALGSRIWSEDVCMVARVGRDFNITSCLLYTSPSPRDPKTSRMPSSA